MREARLHSDPFFVSHSRRRDTARQQAPFARRRGALIATRFPEQMWGARMHIELSGEDAEALRDLLRQRVVELDKEINRTDSLKFKHELQQLDRRLEQVLGEISAALEGSARPA